MSRTSDSGSVCMLIALSCYLATETAAHAVQEMKYSVPRGSEGQQEPEIKLYITVKVVS